MILLVFSVALMSAQTTADEKKYLGNWKMTWLDLPDGNMTVILKITEVDGKLAGVIDEEINADGKRKPVSEVVKIKNIEVNGVKLSLMYHAQGYDVGIEVELEDEKKFTGTMMGRFETIGEKLM